MSARNVSRNTLWILAVLSILFLYLVELGHAGATVTFGWDYDNPPGDFSHFVLEENQNGTWIDVSGQIGAATRQFSLADLPDGTYLWRLVAVDTEALSSASNEVTAILEDTAGPPPPPGNFRIITTIYVEVRNGEVVAHNFDSIIIPID
jgi:hypothetical protein